MMYDSQFAFLCVHIDPVDGKCEYDQTLVRDSPASTASMSGFTNLNCNLHLK